MECEWEVDIFSSFFNSSPAPEKEAMLWDESEQELSFRSRGPIGSLANLNSTLVH